MLPSPHLHSPSSSSFVCQFTATTSTWTFRCQCEPIDSGRKGNTSGRLSLYHQDELTPEIMNRNAPWVVVLPHGAFRVYIKNPNGERGRKLAASFEAGVKVQGRLRVRKVRIARLGNRGAGEEPVLSKSMTGRNLSFRPVALSSINPLV